MNGASEWVCLFWNYLHEIWRKADAESRVTAGNLNNGALYAVVANKKLPEEAKLA